MTTLSPCARPSGAGVPKASVVWLTLSGLVLACGSERREFAPVADVQELMLGVLEPAAEVYWDAVGEILDQDGVHEIRPSTNAEWEAVQNAALVIAESGNLLMMSGRARDRGEWMVLSRAMIESGREALRAAEARNAAAVFDAGAEVYYACSDCHAKYALETLRPSDARTDTTRAGDSVDGSGH